jgi:hypothetical protein
VVSSIGLLRNSKIISAEGLKAMKKTPDLSSMKNSKYVDARELPVPCSCSFYLVKSL